MCGSKLIWQSDFSFEDYGYDEDGVIGIYTCSNEKCNTTFEVMDLLIESSNDESIDIYDYRSIKYRLSEESKE